MHVEQEQLTATKAITIMMLFTDRRSHLSYAYGQVNDERCADGAGDIVPRPSV